MKSTGASAALLDLAAATGATAALCVILHLLFGWQWTLLAGIPVGVLRRPRPFLAGAAGVGLGWLLLVGYNMALAGQETLRMLHFLGSLFGNLPVLAVVAVTAMLGAILGLLGSWVGRRAAILRQSRKPDTSPFESVPHE